MAYYFNRRQNAGNRPQNEQKRIRRIIMAIIKMQRVFRMGVVDLPDVDPSLTPEQILEHYAEQYPQLRRGKVQELGVEGDNVVFSLVVCEYKANG
jgi:PRTRC genetic system protein C